MNKKQILITVIGGVVIFIVSFLLTYFISSNVGKSESNNLRVGSYTLEYGIYKGVEQDYDADKGKAVKKEIKIVLSKDKITTNNISKKYEVKSGSIFVDNVEMYKVTANNKFVLLAGSGVEFVYEKW